jgi:hypothetical protein
MSRNPYAHPDPYSAEPIATRVSGLAVSSLIFGILCCIPGMGLIALVLGGAAMLAISRSDGRLTGRGLATAGLVLGLLGTIFTAMVAMGTLQAQAQVRYFGSSYTFIEQQDVNRLSNMLSPSAQQQLTPEELARFHSEVHASWGKFQGPTKGLGDLLQSLAAAAPHVEHRPRGADDFRPIPMKFEHGTVMAFIKVDPRQPGTRGSPAIDNIMILDTNNQPIWLFPPSGPVPRQPPPPPPSPAQPPEGEGRGPEAEEPPPGGA